MASLVVGAPAYPVGVACRREPAPEPLGGYAEVQPMVFCGLFPTEADRFPDLREALGKLQLNDAALVYEPEVRPVLHLL